jgi:hypothetical protein
MSLKKEVRVDHVIEKKKIPRIMFLKKDVRRDHVIEIFFSFQGSCP